MAQKSKPYTKREKRRNKKAYRRSTYKKLNAQTRLLNNKDPSICLMNAGKLPTLTLSKALNYTLCNYVAGASAGAGNAFVFDPSGTYGNCSASGGPLAMPDWTSLKNVFDLYRVNWIKIHMFSQNTTASGLSADADPMDVYMRYNYESQITTPTLAGITQVPKVIKKTFTQDRPRYTYMIKPKVESAMYNVGASAGWGRGLVNMKWTDVDSPVQLYGFKFYVDRQLTGQQLFFEIEYNVSFKYSK